MIGNLKGGQIGYSRSVWGILSVASWPDDFQPVAKTVPHVGKNPSHNDKKEKEEIG